MEIVNVYVNNREAIYTVALDENVLVDVKCVGNLCYIMSCEDGCETYDMDGNTFDYHYDERSVIRFVKRIHY